jgi:hypothetical protein
MTVRGRRILLVAGIVVAVLAVVLVTAGWYLLAEERRTARLVAGILAGRTGLPVTIERASTDGSALRLRGVRIAASPTLPLDVRAGEVDVAGGLLPLLAPAGRRVSIVAVATSVSLPDGGGGVPDIAALARLRQGLRALLDWPGALTLRADAGALRGPGAAWRFDLAGDKTGGGLSLALSVAPPGSPHALRGSARATAADADAVDVALDLAGEPPRLAGLWPPALPVPATAALRAEARLAVRDPLTITGHVTVAGVGGPGMLDFAGRYDGRDLALPRYALRWGPGISLEGGAGFSGGAVTATARGTLDASPVRGRAVYKVASGVWQADVTVESADAARLARRVGVTPPPGRAAARTLTARLSGSAGAGRSRLTIDALVAGVTTAAVPAPALDAEANAVLVVMRDGAGLRVAGVERANLTLTRERVRVGTVTVSSRGTALLPIALDARLDDLAALAPALRVPSSLAGAARFVGDVVALEGPRVRGTLEAMVPQARFTLGGPVAATDVRAVVPVAWGLAADDRRGSVTVARVGAYGLVVERVSSSAQVADGRLVLPDLRYVHYGGEGGGWMDAGLDGRTPPLRARVEGRRVNLADVVRESGATVARLTGSVRYLATAQYTADRGLVASMRLDSEEGGGEVSIDAIQRLLESATVQAENTGVLRQTLQNLKEFSYESLEGDLRVVGGVGRVDLSMEGKKRLGIFPAPVEAIHMKNVPLSLLARVFGSKETTP